MDHRRYRIVVRYDMEKELFVGVVPELPGCEVEGDNWQEVTAALEESIEAKLDTIEHPPTPLDEFEWDGKLELSISRSLMRELVFMAKNDEVEPEALAQELISEGLGRRYGGHRFYRSGRKGNQKGGRGGHRRNMPQDQYHNIMEDKASFLEYVRGLEEGGPKHQR